MQTQQTQQQKHIDNIDRMIGIIFVQETFINNYDNSRLIYPNEICLGTIILSKYNHLIYANSLRKLIKQESIFQMDDNFVFISPFGCIISMEQESQILICYLITEKNTIQLRRKPKQNCFSLIGFYSSTSNSLPLTSTAIFIDYIYANYYLDLKQLRTIIDDKLEDMKPVNRLKLSNQTYYFRKSSGLIINPINESNIHLIEIINYSNIMIEFERSSSSLSIQDFTDQRNLIAFNQDRSVKKFIEDIPPSTSTTTTALTTATKTNSNNNHNNIEGRSDSILIKNRPSRSIYRRKTTKKRIKQIMISYVRHEAADHALQLKKSLLECGFSVYLDVHEIQMGSDWQDSLNSAVQNCNYFVPLITQNYGRTQWTNREIKLADIKQKHIIPINFLDLWPPECLAIQFATTQYISWNPHSDSNEPNNRYDGKTWPIEEIWEVTNLIKERINKLSLRVTSTTINEDLPSIQQQDNKNHYQSQQQQQQQQSEQQQQQQQQQEN
ncbi:hypothetical protein DERP_011955 [Dermatophagoides pteronyssinus]|uniref:TIR domain-containing protein n=1 Tax=Dermatophagoides pteronyssinus TaxID=6956 RepID=A0ABQ8J2Q7_DERPT|nr:hypothetical protein DERP_011955 [Dermatophagoides pteronyssinus]